MFINRIYNISWSGMLCILCFSCSRAQVPVAAGEAVIFVYFQNTANGRPVVLNDEVYTNAFGEKYSLKKLKYYVSNLELSGSQKKFSEAESYHLIDVRDSSIFSFPIPAGKYNNLTFLLGVDSTRNFSGAQTGDLDPLKDMFWTWNSGYVHFKLEGSSASSKADLNRVEHHLGGYKSPYVASKNIKLDFNDFNFRAGEHYWLLVECNLDKYWKSSFENSITENAINIIAGPLAVRASENFPAMFSVKNILVK